MGYAEKTQLITGLIIWSAAIIGYTIFYLYYKKINRNDLLPFLKVFMLGGFLIGTHQVFEFLSLYTESSTVYKLGLLASISGMALYGLSLEKLYNRNLYIKYLNLTIIPVAIYLFAKPVQFNAFNFHLEHHSIFFWTFTWLILFLYWNISGLFERKNLAQYIPKLLSFTYLFFSMTMSFLIAVIYSLWTHHANNTNICITYPSIWCTLAFLQILVMPFFLYMLPRKIKKLPKRTKISTKSFILYLLYTFFITGLILYYLATTNCFNINFILQ